MILSIRNLILVLMLFGLGTVSAGDQVYSVRAVPTYNSFSLDIEDGRFLELNSGLFEDASVALQVRLGVDERVNLPFINAYAALTVSVTITPIDDANNPVTSGVVTQDLTISYSPDESTGLTPQIQSSVLTHSGYHKYQITGTLTNPSSGPIPLNVYMEAELLVDRYHEISSLTPVLGANLSTYDAAGVKTVAYNLNGGQIGGNNDNGRELEIWWDYIEGAEEYELEWTWIDNYSTSATAQLVAGAIDLSGRDFELNHTRIITADQHYRIPLIYNKGFIVYRVRGVGRWLDGTFDKPKFGPWSSGNIGDGAKVSNWPHYIELTSSHEPSKSWQYQAVYAEEGKKKEIVSYFDGSLRNRQTVTKINSNNEAIVGESVYDNQGRAAVQILPTPVDNAALKYYPQLNKSYNPSIGNAFEMVPFGHQDFDWDASTLVNACSNISNSMSTATGAAKYYSDNNAATGNWQDQVPLSGTPNLNTPLASGFPYTQIEYTPDNTGRIAAQSGVGDTYTIDGEHATRYFYGQPTQEELNRIFGYQVGNVLRYKKNMVVDANGQVSVSYLDPQGRVIATALAGDNTLTGNETVTNLKSLSDEMNPALHLLVGADILAKLNINDPDTQTDANTRYSSGQNGAASDGLKTDYKLLSSKNDNPHNFTYKISQTNEFKPCETDATVYPFAYVLDISFQDACGETLIPDGATSPTTNGVLTQSLIMNSANTEATYSWESLVSIGDYHIAKTLRVDPVKLHEYALDYIANNACVSPLVYESNADCGPDPLPELPFGEKPGESFESNDLSTCSSAEIMMLQDLSPNGQYGATSGSDLLSVFSLANALDKGFMGDQKTWKHPVTSTNHYQDENGNDSYIEVIWDGTNFTPELEAQDDQSNPLTIDANGVPNSTELIHLTGNIYEVRPRYLLHVTDLIANWEPVWASALLPHHPEYEYLVFQNQFCTAIGSSSEAYDATLNQIYTYDQARTGSTNFSGQDLTGVTGITTILTQDPFYTSGIDLSLTIQPSGNATGFARHLLKDVLENYQNTGTLWEFCMATVHCGANFSNAVCSLPPITDPAWTTEEKNQVWGLYKSIYIAEKRKIIQLFIDYYSVSEGCYNGYIGNHPERTPTVNTFMTYPDYAVGGTGWPGSDHLAADGTVMTYLTEAQINRTALVQATAITYNTNWAMAGPLDHLFEAKQSRFAPIDNLYQGTGNASIQLSQSQAESNYQLYLQTGGCALSFELEQFLNAMAENGEFSNASSGSSSISSGEVPEFTPSIYTALGGTIMTSSTGSAVNITTAISGNTLTLTFTDANNGAMDQITLNLPANANTWAYEDILGLSTLYITNQSTPYHFDILAQVDNAGNIEEHILSGSTPMPIGDCINGSSAYTLTEPTPDCERPQAFGNDLFHLFEAVIDNSLPLTTVAALVGGDYIGSELALQLGDFNTDLSTTANLSVTASAGLSPTEITLTYGGNLITLTPTSTVLLSNIQTILSYTIASDGSTMTIQYLNNQGSEASIDISIAMTGGAIDLACACDEELEFAQKFQDMINEAILIDEATVGVLPNGSVFDAFTELETYMSGFTPNGIHNFSFQMGANISLSFSLNPTLCSPVDFASVTPISGVLSGNFLTIDNMVVDVDQNNGFMNSASCDAIFDDGTIIRLEMGGNFTECLKIASCGPCVPEPISPVSCTDAYDDYESLMTSLGLVANDYYDETAYCHSGLAYAQAAYTYYLGELLISSASDLDSDYYLTLAQFTATFLGTGIGLPVGTLEEAIDEYKTAMITNAVPYMSWNAYVATVYLADKDFCLPPIEPNMDISIAIPCEQYTANVDIVNAEMEYAIYLENLMAEFKANYIEEAMNSVVENFDYTYQDKEYHYTLYYYDQAGNLIQTVPPKGVDRIIADHGAINLAREDELDPLLEASAATPFNTASDVLPNHSLETQYRYNSLNQLVWQKTPDGGISEFAYDALGRLVVSQNAKQKLKNDVSYTVYDALGRIKEVGKLILNANDYYFDNGLFYDGQGSLVQLSNTPSQPNITFPNNITNIDRNEVTLTLYDELTVPGIKNQFEAYAEYNTRNRITGVLYYDVYGGATALTAYESGTFYDYDVHGNVKELIQDIQDTDLVAMNQNQKQTKYDYDLVSGNVKEVAYQDGEADQFVHRYTYDADNRITIAETSKDRVTWEKDAKYFYYDHGPLARTEIGDRKVQALDYAYTIQGWLKGVNSENLVTATDQGKDGYGGTTYTNINQMNGKDVMGYSLHYFEGDYTGRQGNSFLAMSSLAIAQPNTNLYNGNIKEMYTASTQTDQTYLGTSHTWYSYDQLNRILSMNQEELQVGSTPAYASGGYSASYSYDANGNLQTLSRSIPGQVIDDFSYFYLFGKNQLDFVHDAAFGTGGIGTSVLADDSDLAGQSAGNYSYDAIGQLQNDVQEEIELIDWKVTGKVARINRTNASLKKDLVFNYDAMGNRISKIIIDKDNAGVETIESKTFYVRDAQGNAMSTYTLKINDPNGTIANENNLYLSERNIYGSSRLGMEVVEQIIASTAPNHANETINSENDPTNNIIVQQIGDKRYELSNHLGNVLQVISDRKLSIDEGVYDQMTGLYTSTTAGDGIIDFYSPDVVSQSDYYPFGMTLPNRHDEGGNSMYRYQFNGKEQDPETYGNGNIYDYGFRIYNPRIGKFLSEDPLTSTYPSLTPYQYASNTPIQAIDLDGLEAWVVTWASQSSDPQGNGATRIGHTGIIVKNYKEVQTEVTWTSWELNLNSGHFEEVEHKTMVTTYEPTGSYTYYDLWPQSANLGGKEAVQDVNPSYTAQEFKMEGVIIEGDAALETWLKNHDASQIDEIFGNGEQEQVETPAGNSSGLRGSVEGRPSNGILKLELTPEETMQLNIAYENLIKNNAQYNGVSNNCTSFICNGLNEIGFNLVEESIYDWRSLFIGELGTGSFTPNETYKQLANIAIMIKGAAAFTTETYEEAIIDGDGKKEK